MNVTGETELQCRAGHLSLKSANWYLLLFGYNAYNVTTNILIFRKFIFYIVPSCAHAL